MCHEMRKVENRYPSLMMSISSCRPGISHFSKKKKKVLSSFRWKIAVTTTGALQKPNAVLMPLLLRLFSQKIFRVRRLLGKKKLLSPYWYLYFQLQITGLLFNFFDLIPVIFPSILKVVIPNDTAIVICFILQCSCNCFDIILSLLLT